MTLWTFLSQVLDGRKSCRAAVARAFAALALRCPLQDLDTGNYCRARAKLATGVLRRLTGTGTRLARRYATTPLLALEIDAAALARLEEMHELVTRVRADRIVPPNEGSAPRR